jgi:hypothetical protein
MNNERRKRLREWLKKMGILKAELEAICSEEEMCYDMLPENLQGSINGTNSEEAIDKMNEAIEYLGEAVEAVEEII